MGQVRRSPQSKVDYLEIWIRVAEASQEAAIADRLVETFEQKVQLLSDFPGIGTSRTELGPNLRSLPVGSYLIFYRPTKRGIELVRVVHGARDLRRLFRK